MPLNKNSNRFPNTVLSKVSSTLFSSSLLGAGNGNSSHHELHNIAAKSSVCDLLVWWRGHLTMCFKENIPQAQSNFCLLPSLSLRHGGDGSCCQDCLLLLFSHIPRLRHRAAVERLSPSQPSIKGATFASGSQNTPSFSPSPTALRSSHPSNTA